ncbi:MAG: cell division protein ZapA [Paramuribaculum sp.]|nr:cell division protein ZapA [Barnesiella sp.]MDE5836011.1 cell division protein ZapA [Paramuribaculum sp.]
MKDKIDINLRIADVALSLSIKPDEEQLFREAAKGINDVWSSWRSRFSANSSVEVLAKVTLLFSKSFLELKRQTVRTEEILDSIEQTLDMLLLDSNISDSDES